METSGDGSVSGIGFMSPRADDVRLCPLGATDADCGQLM